MKNTEQNMNERLDEYIKSYQVLLTEKGYDESSLGNNAPTGALTTNIDRALRELVAVAEKSDQVPIALLKGLGFFGQDREPITLDFGFACDYKAKTIKLMFLKAETHDLKVTCLSELNSSIPAFGELIDTIEQQRKIIQASQKNKQKPKGPSL